MRRLVLLALLAWPVSAVADCDERYWNCDDYNAREAREQREALDAYRNDSIRLEREQLEAQLEENKRLEDIRYELEQQREEFDDFRESRERGWMND